MTSKIKRTLFFLLVLLSFVILAELLLQSVGLYLEKKYQPSNLEKSNLPYTIVTLGESTTADVFKDNENYSWPSQLKKRLEAKGLNVRVINLARPAISLAHLHKYYLELRKETSIDLVIMMAGINDWRGFVFHTESSTFFDRLQNFKILKVLRWIKIAFTKVNHKEVIKNSPHYKFNIDAEKKADYFIENKIQDESFFFSNLKGCPKAAALSIFAARVFDRNDKKPFPKIWLNQFLNPMIDSCSELWSAQLWYLIYASKYREEPSVKQRVRMLIRKFGPNLPDDVLSAMSTLIEEEEKSLYDKALGRHGIKHILDSREVLRNNYNSLLRELLSSEMPVVLMQYPTLKITDLKRLVRRQYLQDQRIVYVENRRNFLKLLDQLGYWQIFKDTFAGSWGHCTPLGNKLIVDNLIDNVVDIVKSK